ncbi:teicoplanin resistance protein VanZ [Longimonas halophila]|uniref:Teicoplanin resistance protein VanZ n=1 Tax=Longimonas halophila TaxID=1469170 RepID=A0A2H3NV64_9BACT|nr:teicoplanin resistance protein VanZ [Longimonas halophila]PEN05638.1 teicoplanin resistance protein VanZ [Longimonas halophila]
MANLLHTLRRPNVWAVLWTLGILVAVTVPAPTVPTGPPEIGLDKIVHLIMFAGFGLLWMRALASWPRSRTLWVVGGTGLALAVGSELVQYAVLATRQGSLYDGVANVLGLALGMAWAVWPPVRSDAEAKPS